MEINAASASKAPVTRQKVHSVQVTQLKNLRDVEIDLAKAPLTALMGANGCGKTTVLHALACAYAPVNGGLDYKFPRFFKPSVDAHWKGSKFQILYEHAVGPALLTNLTQEYTKATERWTPRYDRRPKRYVRYLSVRECVPEIDLLNSYSSVYYTKTDQASEVGEKVRELAGKVLNRQYDNYHSIKYTGWNRSSIGVRTGTLSYSALSMSSGEQRVFSILDAVFAAPKYGLILIDEIDLFLHEEALTKLLRCLRMHCEEKKKQLIFTSHFPSIANLHSEVSIMTLHRTPERTIIWDGYSCEAIRHITGRQLRTIVVYVEDDVAAAIVAQVAAAQRLRKHTEIIQFGAASNAYSVGSGLILSSMNLESTIVLTDGDVITTTSERRENCNRVLSGTESHRRDQRRRLRKLVRMFRPLHGRNPEQMLSYCIRDLDPNSMSQDEQELYEIAIELNNTMNNHGFVEILVERSGEERSVCLSRLCKLASKHQFWKDYVRVLRIWFSWQRERQNIEHQSQLAKTA